MFRSSSQGLWEAAATAGLLFVSGEVTILHDLESLRQRITAVTSRTSAASSAELVLSAEGIVQVHLDTKIFKFLGEKFVDYLVPAGKQFGGKFGLKIG